MTLKKAKQTASEYGLGGDYLYHGLFGGGVSEDEGLPLDDKFKDNDEVAESFAKGRDEYHTTEKSVLLPLYIEHAKAGKEDKHFYGELDADMFIHEDDEPPYENYIKEWRANPTPALTDAIDEAEKTRRERKHDIGKKIVHRSAVIAVSTSSLMHDEINADGIEEGMDEVIVELKKGNMDYLLKSLISNITNVNVDMAHIRTPNKATYKLKKEINTMKVKLLQEQRKSVMAINEIMNPKRTTFVKNAIQNVTNTADAPEQIEAPVEDVIEIVPEIKAIKTLKKGSDDVKSK